LICYRESKVSHTGSGFILRKSGIDNNSYICISNEHVVDNSDSIVIQTTRYPNKTYAISNVVASLHKLDATIFTFRTTDKFDGLINDQNNDYILKSTPKIGTSIITVSSPKGLINTVSNGIVSQTRKMGYKNLIQISAPISSGSSGGVAADINGNPIGLIVSQYNEGQNLNFAVSLSQIMSELVKEKYCSESLSFNRTSNKKISNLNELIHESDPLLKEITDALSNNKMDEALVMMNKLDNDYLTSNLLFLKANMLLEKNELIKTYPLILFGYKKYRNSLFWVLLNDFLEKIRLESFQGFDISELNKPNDQRDESLQIFSDLTNGFYSFTKEKNFSKAIFYLERAYKILDADVENSNPNSSLTADQTKKEITKAIFLDKCVRYLFLSCFDQKQFIKAEEYGFSFLIYLFSKKENFGKDQLQLAAEYYLRSALFSGKNSNAQWIYYNLLVNEKFNYSSAVLSYIESLKK
jgi:hypothetical protein